MIFAISAPSASLLYWLRSLLQLQCRNWLLSQSIFCLCQQQWQWLVNTCASQNEMSSYSNFSEDCVPLHHFFRFRYVLFLSRIVKMIIPKTINSNKNMSAKCDYDYVNSPPSDNHSLEAWWTSNIQNDDTPKWVLTAKKGRAPLTPIATKKCKHDGDNSLVEVWSKEGNKRRGSKVCPWCQERKRVCLVKQFYWGLQRCKGEVCRQWMGGYWTDSPFSSSQR